MRDLLPPQRSTMWHTVEPSREADIPHRRASIPKVMLSHDYLWINIRVKGGAYGCMSGIGRSGEGYFVSLTAIRR